MENLFDITYDSLLARLRDEVAVEDIVPDSGNTVALLKRLFFAVQVVVESVPVGRLYTEGTDFLNVLAPADPPLPGVQYELPDDLILTRPDWGIRSVIIDGERVLPSQSTPEEVFDMVARSPFWDSSGTPFVLDPSRRDMRTAKAALVRLVYCRRPEYPIAEGLVKQQPVRVPLTGGDAETAVYLAAAHLTGQKGNDPVLQELYQRFLQLYSPDAVPA